MSISAQWMSGQKTYTYATPIPQDPHPPIPQKMWTCTPRGAAARVAAGQRPQVGVQVQIFW
ncbi:MAG: hypothetical protein CML31_17960, partial [Rhizobiales bacterium]|nr:hypothetical protein [Hyphomicrobiales bacterium]